MSRIDTVVRTDAEDKISLAVLTMIFPYVPNYADRTNIGAVLPFIIDEFHINNLESRGHRQYVFPGYAVSQIPAGFLLSPNAARGG